MLKEQITYLLDEANNKEVIKKKYKINKQIFGR
jgi:hypothetical protein